VGTLHALVRPLELADTEVVLERLRDFVWNLRYYGPRLALSWLRADDRGESSRC
jgi:hypothetical protein